MADATLGPDGGVGTTTRRTAPADIGFGIAVATVAVAGAYVILRDRAWLPVSDLAILELQLRGLLQDPPLLGSYSRYGWSHPGPLFTYLMWVPWRLTGGNPSGLLLGMLLLHLGAVVVAWFAARAIAVAAAVLVAAGLLVVWAAGAPTDALIPWNPHAGVVLGGTIVALGWNAAGRGRLGALLLLPLASLAVQAHIGTAFLAVAVCGSAIGLSLAGWMQRDPVPWSAWGWSIGITTLLWVAPVWEQLRAGGGNLTAIVATDSGPGLGLGRAIAVVSDAFALGPYWWSPTFKFLPEVAGPPVLLIIPAAATVVAIVRRDPTHVRAVVVCALAGAAAIASVWQATPPGQSYLVAWLPGVAVTIVTLCLWVLLDAWSATPPVVWLAPALLPLAAAGVAINLISNSAPLAEQGARVRSVADAVTQEGLAQGGVHLVTGQYTGSEALEWVPGVANELQRRGTDVSAELPPEWPSSLAELTPSEPGERTPVMIRGMQRPDEPIPADWRVVVTEDPFTPAEWKEMLRLRAVIADEAAPPSERGLAWLGIAEIARNRQAWQILVPTQN